MVMITERRMNRVVTEVYDALIAAGAPEEKARSAASALANYEGRFVRIETELAMIKWIVSGVGVGVALLVIRSFLPV